jgi:hypothetical protein
MVWEAQEAVQDAIAGYDAMLVNPSRVPSEQPTSSVLASA